jgi:hypothetical protein
MAAPLRRKENNMSDIVKDALSNRIKWTHENIISLGEALSAEQFAQQPGPTSPPIGWHLWHTARWADRFQGSFQLDSLEGTYQGALAAEIWKKENQAQQWELSIESLGLLETGATMAAETAVSIACLGKSTLIDYAQRVFHAAEDAIKDLDDKMLTQSRYSILPQLEKKPDEKPNFVGDRKTTVFDELLFYATHAGRHLGMMEALQGTLFSVPGSMSI